MKVGGEKHITVKPEEAYGPVNKAAFQEIPKEKVPAPQRRLAGKKYFFVEGPEYIDVKPAVKIIDDALSGKARAQ